MRTTNTKRNSKRLRRKSNMSPGYNNKKRRPRRAWIPLLLQLRVLSARKMTRRRFHLRKTRKLTKRMTQKTRSITRIVRNLILRKTRIPLKTIIIKKMLNQQFQQLSLTRMSLQPFHKFQHL
jgi:hypothetical protein